MGDPRPFKTDQDLSSTWDRANRNDDYPGRHMIEDMNGDNPKLEDLESGMTVKIKAYETHSFGYKYLYTTEIGKYVRRHNVKVMQ